MCKDKYLVPSTWYLDRNRNRAMPHAHPETEFLVPSTKYQVPSTF